MNQTSGLESTVLETAKSALRSGRADLAVQMLESATLTTPRDPHAWQLLGFAYRDEQLMPEAASAFARAAELCPQDPFTALGHAQSCFESGLPAAQLFRHALALAPDSLPARRSCAAALAAEGQVVEAESILADTLAVHPEWLEGHKSLATLRWLSGDRQDFARSYVEACAASPRSLALRLAWFRTVAQTRDWDAARKIIAGGERLIGVGRALTVAKVFVASESGDIAHAEELFEQTAGIRDDVRDIAHIRHCLRTGRWELAEILATRLVNTTSATTIWPYLSLIWRLRGDSRAQWLDGAPPFIRVIDIDVSPAELAELASLLHKLHTARAPSLEQSVRGGTQTQLPLFFRHETVIQAIKMKLRAAVLEYIKVMPGPQPGHPLLGTRREGILFEGSWSVRLKPHGYHVSHTHPMGWISSAFYVALPEPAQMGAPPSGWISFGSAPPDLGLDLAAYLQIEPKPGRLVLFPSTMWHSTLPFDGGERLVVAFDVRRPKP